MANNTSLSILRDTPLTSNIATEAWTSENFTFLSTTNDLSNKIVSNLSNVINTKLSTIADEVSAEVQRVDEISTSLSNYSLTSHTHSQYATRDDISAAINTLDSEVTGEAGAGKTLTSFSQTDGKVTAGFADIAITKSQVTDFPTIPTVSDGILTIQKNGTAIASFSANQSTNVSANISVPTKTSELTNDSGFVVSSDLIKVMEYQGSVTTYADLPSSGNKQGDVWNVVSAYNENPPGTNYAWDGTTWDPLGGNIDVSNFATKSQLTNYLPLSGGSMTGALSANSGFRADGYGGTTGLSIGNGENDEYYTRLIANVIKTPSGGGGVVFENGYGYGLSVDGGSASDFYGTYLNATKVKSEELFVNADMYGGGLSVGQGTDYIYGTYIDATNLTAPGMIAGNSTAPHGGLSVTGIDFGDGSYLSSANGFASISALDNLSAEVINGLSNEVLPKLSTIGDLTIEQSQKINAISATYISGVVVNNTPKTVTNNVVDLGTVLTAHQSLSGYTPLSTTNDLISTINDELSGNINPKISSIADEVSAETVKLDELSGSLSAYAKLSATKLNIQDDYTEWVLSPSYISADNPTSPWPAMVGQRLKLVLLNTGSETGWQLCLEDGTPCGAHFGNLSSTELSWNGNGDWAGNFPVYAKRYKKGAVLGDQTSATLALENHSHALSDIANLPGVVQTGSYNDLLDKPTNFLSAETDPVFSAWVNGESIAAGNGATVGTLGVSIGNNASSTTVGIAIGLSANSKTTGIAIGRASESESSSIAIGTNSKTKSNSVVLGANASSTISGAIAIGRSATATALAAIAIGGQTGAGIDIIYPAKATARGAIQLGSGTNETANTFQVWDKPLLDSNGNIPEARVSAIGYIKGADVPLSDYTPLSTTTTLSNEVVVEISSVINPKLSTIISLVSSEVDKLDEISGNLSNYVDISSHQIVSGEKIFTNTVRLSGSTGDEIWMTGGATNLDPQITFFGSQGYTAGQTIGSSNDSGLYFSTNGKSGNSQSYCFPGGTDQYDTTEQIIATERYAKQARNVLPILAMTSSTVNLSADTYVYRVTDSNNTGTFPTLVAPTDIVQPGDYYFTFEIEWTTAASLASYAVQYDWINYPEMQTDGTSHTYYITGRWDSGGSGASAFTLNCWRVK